ncbi:MAG TPA: hypothetical protein VGI48_06025 [Caldimonas sp.]|jgi:uncharacterized membrane protein
MNAWLTFAPSVLASFMASAVEFVEALTIVLAVGVVRGWRPAWLGAIAGVVVLAALVLALGPSLAAVPLPVLQVVVGTLLSMFGLRWLQKAVLRAAGIVPLHDEDVAYASTRAALRGEGAEVPGGFDAVAFLASFKAVVLEGIEVVFIVIALGARGTLLLPATVGATLALLAVLVLGLALRRPLSRVPENTLKFGVGVMLSAFGTFWVGEGIGLAWPGGDAAILVLMAAILAISLVLVSLCRRSARMATRASAVATVHAPAPPPGMWRRFASELLGLFVGDGRLAIGILAWSVGAWIAQAQAPNTSSGACLLFALGTPLMLVATALRCARR